MCACVLVYVCISVCVCICEGGTALEQTIQGLKRYIYSLCVANLSFQGIDFCNVVTFFKYSRVHCFLQNAKTFNTILTLTRGHLWSPEMFNSLFMKHVDDKTPLLQPN